MTDQEKALAILEEMVTARIESTGEDRRTACMAVKKHICQHLYAQQQQQENN
jgi:hypothetical protein